MELAEGASLDAIPDTTSAPPPPAPRVEGVNGDQPHEGAEPPPSELTLADGVTLVRQVLAEATVPPRWPMYLRQMKQFLRNARPDFDERRYGSLQDLLRACQKVGLVRLERDRQGGLRAFAGAAKPYMPQGWVAPETEVAADMGEASSAAVDAMVVTEGDVAAGHPPADDVHEPVLEGSSETFAEPVESPEPAPSSDSAPRAAQDEEADADDQLAMFGVVRPTDPEPMKARRPRARKTAQPREERPRRTRKAPVRRARTK